MAMGVRLRERERERTLWEGKRENVMREYLSGKENKDGEKRE